MQFLISVIDDQTGSATPQEMAAIDAFNTRLQEAGHWVVACGITSPSQACVIDSRGPETVTTDGPLHESTEYVSGFWLITAPDAAEARALAAAGSRACNRRVELRPLLGA
jgi:hypothetical protein